MLLAPGVRLTPGLIKTALLYPAVGNVAYAQISEIGRKDRRNNQDSHIVVTDGSGDVLCEVLFSENSTIGTAYHNGEVCGYICGGESLIPILNDYFTVEPGALVFTPSVFRPVPTAAPAYAVRYKNERINSVEFMGGTAIGEIEVVGGTASIIGRSVSMTGNVPAKPVKQLHLTAGTTSVTLGGVVYAGPDTYNSVTGGTIVKNVSGINILPYVSFSGTTVNSGTDIGNAVGGCLRVVATEANTITIGTAFDV